MMSEDVLSVIKSKGHWKVILRPKKFVKERIDSLRECKEIISKAQVRLTGWDYPYIDPPPGPISGNDFVSSSVDYKHYKEFWRFYQSGQFVHFIACKEDWVNQEELKRQGLGVFQPDAKGGSFLSILSTLYLITQMYEFAARLAEKGVFDGEMEMSLELYDMNNRQLFFWDATRTLFRAYICHIPTITKQQPISVERLLGSSAELALETTLSIFERFNWDEPPRGIFVEEQKKLLERRL